MASIICDNCGTNNFENAKNCRSCLQMLGLKDITKKSDESIFLQTEFDKIPESTEYQIPKDYVETSSYGQRLRAVIWDRDIHVVKELARRKDLQGEAVNRLFVVLALMSILTIIDWTVDPDINISRVEYVLGTVLHTFTFGYFFLFILTYLGRLITGNAFIMDRNYVFRPLSYIFAIRLLDTFIHMLGTVTNNAFVGLFYTIIIIYEVVLFSGSIAKILDTKAYVGFITAAISYLIALTLSLLTINLFFFTVDVLF